MYGGPLKQQCTCCFQRCWQCILVVILGELHLSDQLKHEGDDMLQSEESGEGYDCSAQSHSYSLNFVLLTVGHFPSYNTYTHVQGELLCPLKRSASCSLLMLKIVFYNWGTKLMISNGCSHAILKSPTFADTYAFITYHIWPHGFFLNTPVEEWLSFWG